MSWGFPARHVWDLQLEKALALKAGSAFLPAFSESRPTFVVPAWLFQVKLVELGLDRLLGIAELFLDNSIELVHGAFGLD